MEWILVLVFSFQATSPPTIATIGGFKSEASCIATLESVKKAGGEKYQASPMAVSEMYKLSLCVQRAK